MADLGYENKPLGESVDDTTPETTYPSLDLRDENVDKVKESHECKVGDIYNANVRLRVKSVSDDDMGQRLGFDVLELNEFRPEEGEYEEEEPVVEEEEETKKAPRALTYAPPAGV